MCADRQHSTPDQVLGAPTPKYTKPLVLVDILWGVVKRDENTVDSGAVGGSARARPNLTRRPQLAPGYDTNHDHESEHGRIPQIW